MVNLIDYLKPLCKLFEMDTPRSLDKDLWVIDHPFKMAGAIELGTRTTLVRLADGGLWLHSPGPLTPGIQTWLEQNGPVRALVAPNQFHHLFLAETAAAFPDAKVYGPEGLQAKLSDKAALDRLQTLTPQTAWADDLDALLIAGCPLMNEWAFLHASSKTLVLTDLAFNFQSSESFITRLFLRLNGALGHFGASRLARAVMIKDRSLARTAVEHILSWDFDRVIVSHGEVLESGGHDALRQGFGWLLKG